MSLECLVVPKRGAKGKKIDLWGSMLNMLRTI